MNDSVSEDIRSLITGMRVHRLVFLHTGLLFELDSVRGAITEECQGQYLSPVFGDVLSLGNPEMTGPDDDPPPALAAVLYVVEGLEKISRRPDRCEILGRARIWVETRLAAGSRVLLWSHGPAVHLYGCPGSSIIRDSKHAFIRPMNEAAVTAHLEQAELKVSARRAFDITRGLPRLLNGFTAAVSEAEGKPNKSAYELLLRRLRREVTTAIEQLGPEVAAWLDDMVFRCSDETRRHEAGQTDVISAGRGAGLLRSNDGWESYSFVSGTLFADGLRDYCDGGLATPWELGRIYSDLWEIEHILRSFLVKAAQNRHGVQWRDHCIGDKAVRKRCLGRAQDDGYLSSTIGEVPNPIEWLTSSELNAIVLEEEWARPTAVPHSVLAQGLRELAPIRNRMAHMRLLHPDDASKVARWRRTAERIRDETMVADKFVNPGE